MDKMTEAEIQAAGRIIMEIARKNGYDEGRYFANMLKKEMVSHQNTSHEDIRAFEETTGYLWEYSFPSSSKLELFIFAILLVLYVFAEIMDDRKKDQS